MKINYHYCASSDNKVFFSGILQTVSGIGTMEDYNKVRYAVADMRNKYLESLAEEPTCNGDDLFFLSLSVLSVEDDAAN